MRNDRHVQNALRYKEEMNRPVKERIYVKSKYSERQLLKALRCRYDKDRKQWYTFKDNWYYDVIIKCFEVDSAEKSAIRVNDRR